jgi:hypothetical protein
VRKWAIADQFCDRITLTSGKTKRTRPIVILKLTYSNWQSVGSRPFVRFRKAHPHFNERIGKALAREQLG